jgi:hypothetical protein
MEIRRTLTIVEDIEMEGGRKAARPVRRVASIAVITNPAAGKYVESMDEFIDIGTELGTILAQKAFAHFGSQQEVESFGKACIVGEAGELEQAAALIHPTYGKTVRAVIGGGKAGIPSAKKIAGPGSSIDVPLGYRDNTSVASHFDGMEIRVPGSPKADEIVVALVLTNGGRPHPRIPGLKKDDVK